MCFALVLVVFASFLLFLSEIKDGPVVRNVGRSSLPHHKGLMPATLHLKMFFSLQIRAPSPLPNSKRSDFSSKKGSPNPRTLGLEGNEMQIISTTCWMLFPYFQMYFIKNSLAGVQGQLRGRILACIAGGKMNSFITFLINPLFKRCPHTNIWEYQKFSKIKNKKERKLLNTEQSKRILTYLTWRQTYRLPKVEQILIEV